MIPGSEFKPGPLTEGPPSHVQGRGEARQDVVCRQDRVPQDDKTNKTTAHFLTDASPLDPSDHSSYLFLCSH